MNLKEDIIFLLESYEKSYEKILTKLNEYDVEGLDNLINLISCMQEKNYFIDFYNVVEHVKNLDEFKYKKNPIYNSSNEFIEMACSKLNESKFQWTQSDNPIVDLSVLNAILVFIEFNFYFYSNCDVKSIQDVVKLVFNSEIICHFTFFVDEFKEGYAIPNYSENFFDKISKITFSSEKSKELYEDIGWNYISVIMAENRITQRFNNHICINANYLMACNALKHGRDAVSCEDVVVGYTLALKLLTEDIREYVIKYYNEDKDLKITDFIVDKNSEDEGLGFKGAVSIIFAILAFLEVILVTTAIISPLGLEFANNPIIRIPTLIVSFYVARKFYNYLTEGNDKDLFEKGKSKAMIIFIIIFIITSVMGFI